jgi:hypothetical protein
MSHCKKHLNYDIRNQQSKSLRRQYISLTVKQLLYDLETMVKFPL